MTPYEENGPVHVGMMHKKSALPFINNNLNKVFWPSQMFIALACGRCVTDWGMLWSWWWMMEEEGVWHTVLRGQVNSQRLLVRKLRNRLVSKENLGKVYKKGFGREVQLLIKSNRSCRKNRACFCYGFKKYTGIACSSKGMCSCLKQSLLLFWL